MMNYEEFKAQVVDTFATYLPKKYEKCKIKVSVIPKINMEMEAINVDCQGDIMAQPTLYLQGLYKEYIDSRSLEDVLKSAAYIFSQYCIGMEKMMMEMVEIAEEVDKYSIVINLIATEHNGHLLDQCPHHEEMDMTVIYRQVVFLDDGSFNGRILMNDDLESLGMTEEELYLLALSNTERLFPVEIKILDDQIYKISNQCSAHGAATMLYPGLLKSIAEEWGDDLYVLPSSIHEVILVAITGQEADRLRALVIDANMDLVKKPILLTNNIYRYYRDTEELKIVCEKNKGPVS